MNLIFQKRLCDDELIILALAFKITSKFNNGVENSDIRTLVIFQSILLGNSAFTDQTEKTAENEVIERIG